MNIKLQRLSVLLSLFMVIMLAGCIGFGDPLDAEDQEKIDQQIREAIEKTFPLPDQVVIKTHVGGDLRFITDLSLDEVVAFYRDAYIQKGYEEGKDSQVLADSATLFFRKDGEKNVALEVTAGENGSDVHLFLKSP
ncbi:MAG TPA: hypothetical protein VI524_12445 [Anaerolineales bacterium]|nr:hypothetical protein [Anaerolineales bacterium]